MPKLDPLKVPWQISPSTPHLGVNTRSLDGVNHGFVTFMGFLGENTRLYAEHGAYCQIAVILDCIVGVRMYPDFSPEDSARLESYDWKSIPEYYGNDGSLGSHVKQFHEHWNATDTCPDPSAYLVCDSEWLRRLGFSSNDPSHLRFQHYLFLGNDYNIEIIAKSFRWEIVPPDHVLENSEEDKAIVRQGGTGSASV